MRLLHVLILLIWLAPQLQAQEDSVLQDVNVDDLGNVTDEFQESFFEALKQKGIENYDRAITALDKCITLRPGEPILYFEKGKNHALLGNMQEAENNYQKALQLKPNQKDIMESLYEVYYARQDFQKAEELLIDLSDFDIQYKEDLARVYLRTREFDKAISILDELDKKLGKDAYRDQIRQQAFALSGGDLQEKSIRKELAANPKEEQNYLKLIYLYSEQGNTEKAYAAARELLKVNPKSEVVHLALYKFYLEKGEIQQAMSSMEKVFKSNRIETAAKHSVLNDFLLFTDRNPEYGPELEKAVALFSENEAVDLSEELGTYYLKNKDNVKALEYYESAYKKEPQDINILRNLMMLQVDNLQFEKAVLLSEEALELYPTQALFYLVYGVAQNALGNHKQAIDYLEMGLDYVLENPKMQSDFYSQLAAAYERLGNAEKANEYLQRINLLKN